MIINANVFVAHQVYSMWWVWLARGVWSTVWYWRSPFTWHSCRPCSSSTVWSSKSITNWSQDSRHRWLQSSPFVCVREYASDGSERWPSVMSSTRTGIRSATGPTIADPTGHTSYIPICRHTYTTSRSPTTMTDHPFHQHLLYRRTSDNRRTSLSSNLRIFFRLYSIIKMYFLCTAFSIIHYGNNSSLSW